MSKNSEDSDKSVSVSTAPSQAGDSDWLDRVLDIDRLQEEGPTLRVVTENMRAILACIGMLAACAYMFQWQPGNLFMKIVAVLIGLWTLVFTFLAAFQFFVIIFFGVLKWLYHVVRPEILKRNLHSFMVVFVVCALFGVLGILILVFSSVSKALGH